MRYYNLYALMPLAEFSDKKIPISTRRLREIRRLAEKAGKAVHSNAAIHREDKKMILGVLAAAKKMIDEVLQLELFSPDQLE
jgi:hypothetical protein